MKRQEQKQPHKLKNTRQYNEKTRKLEHKTMYMYHKTKTKH